MKIDLPLIQDNENKESPLANCIRNNYKHIRKWAVRTHTNCFRIYDRDIKEYPIAIDFYAGRFCVHYFAFNQDGPREDLREAMRHALSTLFQADPALIYERTRIKREKVEQYEKSGESKDFFEVLEYGVKFWVNLTDYLDTGLFLDHRETRRYVASIAKNKRVLNLFAYTCSFSVHAAVAGALSTKSVDLSNTYTSWGKDNFILNQISLRNHLIIRDDCLKFLECEKDIYDIIVIDPPTISRSKKMERMFDVQIDYIFLISKALDLLSEKGMIVFSTNLRSFVFDESQFLNCRIVDVSKKTIPIDFRDPKIHRCWLISHSNIIYGK